jgi:hypothetical protein
MSFNSVRSVALVITIKLLKTVIEILYIISSICLYMKQIAVWVLLGMFLVSGILMKGQQSEATDYTNSTLPRDNTTTLIEEEKEQEETNVTTPTDIKSGL